MMTARLDPRLAALLAVLLLALGLWRGGTLLVHEPLVGLANNYDMIRVQGCIEAYPIRDPSIPAWHNSWQAPLPRYAFRDDVRQRCFPTSEALFAFASLPVMHWQAARSEDGGFSLRVVGAAKFVALALAAIALVALALRRGARAMALAVASVYAVVLSDPGVTVYLNTFYAEFSAVFFTFAALALVCLALERARDGPAPGPWLLGVLALTVVLACLSKLQHLVVGLGLFGALVLAWRVAAQRPPGRVLAAVGLGAVLGLALQAWHLGLERTTSIRHANLTNTVLMAVLPSSDDPARTARTLGLPERCADHAGKTWFTEGLQQNHPCPELLGMSRARFGLLAVREPLVFARTYLGGIERARPWVNGIFGLVAGGERLRLPPGLPTLDGPLNALPLGLFGFLLLAPALASALWIALPLARTASPALAFALLFTGLYPTAALGIVVFGDGFADTAKQFQLGMSLLISFWMLATGAAIAWLVRRAGAAGPGPSGPRPRETA